MKMRKKEKQQKKKKRKRNRNVQSQWCTMQLFTTHRSTPTQCPSRNLWPAFPLVYTPNMTSCGMEYPSGQFGSQLCVPFHLLIPPSLLTAGLLWEAEESSLNVKAAEQQPKHQCNIKVSLKMLPSVTSHFFHTKLKDAVAGAKCGYCSEGTTVFR